MKKIAFRLIKISFFIAVFLFVIFTVLSRIGGNSDVLRGAIEDYLSEASGYAAHVGKLNTMQFFPDIVIDVENVELQNVDLQPVIVVNKFKIAFSFFDVMFSRGRFREFSLENLGVAPGIFSPQAIVVSRAKIEEKSGKGQLSFSGKMGDSEIAALAVMEAAGSSSRRVYWFGESWNFEALLADMALRGTVQKNPGGDLKVEPVSLVKNKRPVLSGWLEIKRLGEGHFDLKGRLEVQPYKSVLNPNIVLSAAPFSVRGKMDAEKIVYEDFISPQPLAQTVQAFVGVFLQDVHSAGLSVPDGLDLDMRTDHFVVANIDWGRVDTKLVTKDKTLHIGPLAGKIHGGDLSGMIDLSAAQSPVKLSVDAKVTGLEYTNFQTQKSEVQKSEGKGDLRLTLSSDSKDTQALSETLAGRLMFVGGAGSLSAGVLEVFGDGFLKSFLPGVSPQTVLNLNCMVIGLDIADQKAQGQPLFLDAKELTLTGQGAYNFATKKAEFTFEPKAKAGGVGYVDAAVSVTGSLESLVAKPSTYGTAADGLSKGAKNPDFSALSLDGIELPADHPCKQFVIESEVLAPPVFEKTAP